MLPYILLYFVSFILSMANYLKEKIDGKVLFFLLMLFTGIFGGSRYGIGGYDYSVYELMYNNTSSNISEALSSGYFLLTTTEKGYIIIMSIFNFLGFGFNDFLLCMGILCSIGLYFVFIRNSKLPYVILTIFLAKGYLYFFFTAQRQVLAMVLCWLAISYIVKKKFLIFFLLVILASFFHTSAIMFTIMYPIANIKLDNKKTIFLLIASILIGVLKIGLVLSLFVSSYLPFGTDKLSNYLEGGGLGINILNFIEMIPILFIILYFRKRIEGKVDNFNLFFNMYIVFVMITFAFYDFVFIARLKGYFILGYFVILSSLGYIPQKKKVGSGIIFLLLLYCLAVYSRELLTFDGGAGYMPYKSYLFKDF